MSDDTRTYVRIDTGHGPPDKATHPIELHGRDGVLRLTVEDAEGLADRLRAAAHAVRVLDGARTARPALPLWPTDVTYTSTHRPRAAQEKPHAGL